MIKHGTWGNSAFFFSVCVCVCVCVCVLPPTNAFTTAFHLESLSQAPLPPCPWRLNENFIYRVFEFEIISIYKKQSFYTSATYSFIYLFDICPFSLFPYAISSFQGWKVRVFFQLNTMKPFQLTIWQKSTKMENNGQKSANPVKEEHLQILFLAPLRCLQATCFLWVIWAMWRNCGNTNTYFVLNAKITKFWFSSACTFNSSFAA